MFLCSIYISYSVILAWTVETTHPVMQLSSTTSATPQTVDCFRKLGSLNASRTQLKIIHQSAVTISVLLMADLGSKCVSWERIIQPEPSSERSPSPLRASLLPPPEPEMH